MGLKRYIVAALSFILITTLFFLAIGFLEVKTVSVLGMNVSFPLVLWIILPLVFLFLATLFHFSYYSMSDYFKSAQDKKEYERFIEGIRKTLLRQESDEKIESKDLKTLHTILKCTVLTPKEEGISGHSVIDEVLTAVRKIRKGEWVDLTKYKLDAQNRLLLENERNHLLSDPKYADNFLKNCAKESPFCYDVFVALAAKGEARILRKVTLIPNAEVIATVISRIGSKSGGFTIDDVVTLVKKGNFSVHDFLLFAKTAYKKCDPDTTLALFTELAKEHKEAMEGELYLAMQYELKEKTHALLAQSDEDEALAFKAFQMLKEAGLRVKLDDFLKSLANG